MRSTDGRIGTLMPGAEAIHLIKLNKVNPRAYLADLLSRLVNGWPQARIDELMPWCATQALAA